LGSRVTIYVDKFFLQVHFKVSAVLYVMFLFANGVIDIGGKFAAGITDSGGKIATGKTTQAVPVAKFTAGINALDKVSQKKTSKARVKHKYITKNSSH